MNFFELPVYFTFVKKSYDISMIFLQFKDMHVPGITILNLITKHVLYRNVYCIIIGYKLYLCF